jgi:hypothetical protein
VNERTIERAARTAAEPRWMRRRPARRESLAALGAGLGVGLLIGGVVFYVARLLQAREPLGPAPARGEPEAP